MVDQGVAAASNLMLLVAATRVATTRDVGSVALVLTAYTLILGSCRAWILDPLLLARTSLTEEQILSLLSMVGLTIGAGGLLVVLTTSPNVGDSVWTALWLGMPLLLLQDGIRYVGFAHQRPEVALVADLAWVAFFGVFLVVMNVTPATITVAWLTWAWVTGAALGAAAGLLLTHRRVRRGSARALWRNFTSFHHSLLADYLLGAGIGQITTFALPSLVGLGGIGALRTAQSVFGLSNVLFAAAYVRTLPLCVSYFPTDRRRVYRRLVGTSLALAAVGCVMTAVILTIPVYVGNELLGSTWAPMRRLALPVGLSTVAGGLLAGASMGLRILGAGRDIVYARVFIATTSTLTVFGFAYQWSADGAAWGGVVGGVVSACLYWGLFVRLVRQARYSAQSA